MIVHLLKKIWEKFGEFIFPCLDRRGSGSGNEVVKISARLKRCQTIFIGEHLNFLLKFTKLSKSISLIFTKE
jgi:hypothetical protein